MVTKKHIRVKFVDQYRGWSREISRDYRLLASRYEVELCEHPDFVMCGGLGDEHLRYGNSVKILAAGENLTPDFNLYDYAYGFDRLTFGDRYLRFPLYVDYDDSYARVREPDFPADERLLDRKFCSFVVSNANGDPLRAQFFRRLSRYKRVDSGGGWLNNMGGRVKDKRAFCAQYKFNLAFENSCLPGYVTEKIVQPLAVASVPVYYGAPDVEKDFSEDCFIRVKSAADMDAAIDRIVALDRDDDDYLAMCKAPRLPPGVALDGKMIADFLYSIFDRDPGEARRRADYGMQRAYHAQQAQLSALRRAVTAPARIWRCLRSKAQGRLV